jgi:triosephosphate isomerase
VGDQRYFLVNWKMFPTVEESVALFQAIQTGLRERAEAGRPLARVIVCPPYVSLVPLRALVDEQLVRLGAQNCHWEQQGPYTGEISPRMLRGLVDYVMIGHRERRTAGETDEQIAAKIAAIGEAGLIPVLFVGEDNPSEDAISCTDERLRKALSRVDLAAHDVLVIYEPSWAIGASSTAPAQHVDEIVTHMKRTLAELGNPGTPVIYGGSVAPELMGDLIAIESLDGLGATRAALEAESFLRIVDLVAGS